MKRVAIVLCCLLLPWGGVPAVAAEPPPPAAIDEQAAVEIVGLREAARRRVAEAFAEIAELLAKGPSAAGEMRARNQAVQDAIAAGLKRLVAAHGWPGSRLVGRRAAEAALDLPERVKDAAFQRWCLDEIERADARGELPRGRALAEAVDGLLTAQGREQRYGTSWTIDFEVAAWVVPPIAEAAGVDARRRDLGLPPLAEELALRNAVMSLKGKGQSEEARREALIAWLDGHDFFRYAAAPVAAAARHDGSLLVQAIGRTFPLALAELGAEGALPALRAVEPFLAREGAGWKALGGGVGAEGSAVELDGERVLLWSRAEKSTLSAGFLARLAAERLESLLDRRLEAARSAERAWVLVRDERAWIVFATPAQRLALELVAGIPGGEKVLAPE
jgi:hypothetical protein